MINLSGEGNVCVCVLHWELVGSKVKGGRDKDRVTRAAIVVMKDHFILAALTMVIFHH